MNNELKVSFTSNERETRREQKQILIPFFPIVGKIIIGNTIAHPAQN